METRHSWRKDECNDLKLDFEPHFNEIRLLSNRGIHLPFLALPPIPDFELSDHQYSCYSKFEPPGLFQSCWYRNTLKEDLRPSPLPGL